MEKCMCGALDCQSCFPGNREGEQNYIRQYRKMEKEKQSVPVFLRHWIED